LTISLKLKTIITFKRFVLQNYFFQLKDFMTNFFITAHNLANDCFPLKFANEPHC